MATLHSPIARWPSSSSARVTMPTGLVKSTIHAPGRRAARDLLGEVEQHGHGAQRLGKAARPRRLLADQCRTRVGSVSSDQARLLTADAQLDEHEIGAVERRRRGSLVIVEPAAQPSCRSIRCGQAADDLPPLRRRCRRAPAHRPSRRVERRAMPSTSSGVYVLPPPTTADLQMPTSTPILRLEAAP